MPDTPQNQNPPAQTTPAPPSSPPPSGTPTNASGSVPQDLIAPEYRYPDNATVPEYLRGKTASDAAMLLQGLVEAAGRNSVPPAAPPPPDLSSLANDEFVTKANLQQAQQAALSQVNPWLQTVADQQATMSYNFAKEQDKQFFQKYEPEIIQVLNQVPRHQWTLDVIKKATTFVKGTHHDELAAEKVRQLEATLDSAMRSTGRAGLNQASSPTESVAAGFAKVPKEWQARAKAVGITEEQVREFCWANETTPEEFFKQFGPGLIGDAVAEMNFGGKITL